MPPSHERSRLRSLVSIVGGGTPSESEENWNGGVPFVTPPDLRAVHGGVCSMTSRSLTDIGAVEGSTVAPKGAVVVSKRAPIGYVAHLAMDAAFNQGCLALVPRRGRVHARFLAWALSARAPEMQNLGRGTTFMEMSAGELADLRLWVPDLSLQRSIADHLDRETARIDALIEKQQQLIETLRERRTVIAERTVFGLDWMVPLRSAVRLIQTGPFGSQLSSAEYVDGGVTVINPSHLVQGRIVPDSQISVSSEKADELKRHQLAVGDVVMARRGELGRCAVVDVDTAGCLCGTGSAIVRPAASKLQPRFLAMVLSSRVTRDALAMQSVGATMDNLNAGILAGLRLPAPPLEVQARIVSEVELGQEKVDALIAKAEQFITLARERRAALITAAVTGQIDVREAS